MELKDKLNLLWKFLFLAVFTYGVCAMTCCNKSSSSCCSKSGQVAPCKLSNPSVKKTACGPNCAKPCCAKTK